MSWAASLAVAAARRELASLMNLEYGEESASAVVRRRVEATKSDEGNMVIVED